MELARFCRIALGSANELEYHILLARDLGFLEESVHVGLAGDIFRVKRMLARLVATVSADSR